jgi:hypothetical protein
MKIVHNAEIDLCVMATVDVTTAAQEMIFVEMAQMVRAGMIIARLSPSKE